MSWQKLFILMADYILSSPPLPSPPFPSPKSQENPPEKNQKTLPTASQNHPKALTLFSLFCQPFRAGFSFSEERQKTPEPQYFQGIGRDKGRKKEEGFVGDGWLLGCDFWGQGRGRDGKGKEEDLGDLCSSRS